MRCPNCGKADDKVIESRTMANGESIRRRRECLSCGFRFTSYERIEEKPFMVVKRDGRRQPFDRDKLAKGIERALEKRPVSTSMVVHTRAFADDENLKDITIGASVTEIEDEAYLKGKLAREIATSELGELALLRLNQVDKVAYIRFASVYKHFNSIEEFITEVNTVGGAKSE